MFKSSAYVGHATSALSVKKKKKKVAAVVAVGQMLAGIRPDSPQRGMEKPGSFIWKHTLTHSNTAPGKM